MAQSGGSIPPKFSLKEVAEVLGSAWADVS
jgi:hypothetical protein